MRTHRLGLFLAFQYPVTIPGVKVSDFLRHAVTNVRNPNRKDGESLMPMREFRKELKQKMEELGMDTDFARRYLNEGFSGGEKKRMKCSNSRCYSRSLRSSTKPTAVSTATPSAW